MQHPYQHDHIVPHLVKYGYCITPAFLSAADVQTLRTEVDILWREGEFQAASIGRGASEQRQPEIRGDFIYWLNPSDLTPTQTIYWHRIDQLRQQLNHELFLNVQEFEAHLAVYPAGAFYKRHLDQHQNTQRRQIACILYLNVDWNSADGGQLRIYPDAEDENEFIEVEPLGGTLICFRCDTIYHEVLSAQRERVSLTGWLCRRS